MYSGIHPTYSWEFSFLFFVESQCPISPRTFLLTTLQGDVAYSEWREFQDTQKLEKEDFIQKEALKTSFPKYKVLRRGGR